jgi:hypothetical protein
VRDAVTNLGGKVQAGVFGTMALCEYNRCILKYAEELDVSAEILSLNLLGRVTMRLTVGQRPRCPDRAEALEEAWRPGRQACSGPGNTSA